jgi:hypothetical protein
MMRCELLSANLAQKASTRASSSASDFAASANLSFVMNTLAVLSFVAAILPAHTWRTSEQMPSKRELFQVL